MVPTWLESLSLAFIAAAVLCSLTVLLDLTRHPQKMWIMDVV